MRLSSDSETLSLGQFSLARAPSPIVCHQRPLSMHSMPFAIARPSPWISYSKSSAGKPWSLKNGFSSCAPMPSSPSYMIGRQMIRAMHVKMRGHEAVVGHMKPPCSHLGSFSAKVRPARSELMMTLTHTQIANRCV